MVADPLDSYLLARNLPYFEVVPLVLPSASFLLVASFLGLAL